MAIHPGDQPASATASQAEAPNTQNTQKQTAAPETVTRFERTFSAQRFGGTERAETLRNALVDRLAHRGLSDTKVIVLDRDSSKLAIDIVLLSATAKAGNPHVFVVPLFVEGSADGLNDQVIQKKVQCPTTGRHEDVNARIYFTDFMEGNAHKAVIAKANREFAQGTKGAVLHVLQPMPVRKEADLGDDGNFQTIDTFIFNAFDQISSKMQDMDEELYKEATGHYKRFMQENQLQIKTEVNPSKAFDLNGLPIRADQSYVVTARQIHRKDEGLHIHANRPHQVVRTDTYIDLVEREQKIPLDTTPVYNFQGIPQPSRIPWYRPVVHITNVQPMGMTNSLADILLGIASLTVVSSPDAMYAVLASAFQPRHSSGGVDLRNLGAIGLEVPGLVVDTEGKENYQNLQLASDPQYQMPNAILDLVKATIEPAPIFALHVEQHSPLRYRMKVFLDLVDENEAVREKAKKTIIKEMDLLTGDRFSAMWNPSAPIVQTVQTRLHTGYVTNETGAMVDIRALQDHLAMLNVHGSKDMSVVADWDDLVMNDGIHPEVREERREMLIRSSAAGSIVQTGRACVLLITPDFLTVAAKCISESLNMRWMYEETAVQDTRVRNFGSLGQGRVQGSVVQRGMTQNAGQTHQSPFGGFGGGWGQ